MSGEGEPPTSRVSDGLGEYLASLLRQPSGEPWTHPLFRGCGEKHPAAVLWMLEATTEREWRGALAWLVAELWLLAAGDRPADPDLPLLASTGAELAEEAPKSSSARSYLMTLFHAIHEGFTPRPHRARDRQQMFADFAAVLGDTPQTAGLGRAATVAEAAKRIAADASIRLDTARKRVERLEREFGVSFARSPRFGKKP